MSSKNLVFKKCNLCNKNTFKIYFRSKTIKNQQKGRRFATTSNYVGNEQIVKCNNCGLIYVNPQIKQKKIIAGYESANEETYIKEKKARTKTFKNCLNKIEKYCKPPAKILDVGCAAGLFLQVARKAGWETYGVEPNKWLAEWGKKNLGLNIINKSIEKVNLEQNFFDVITFWDVLEHLSNPRKSLEKANKLLKRGGYLVVNYPDIGSPLARIFGRKWWFILSVHLYYFTPQTITKMLEKTGFKVIKIKPHIQKLSLGYLTTRLKPYSSLLFKIVKPIITKFKLTDLEIPYYAAQTMVVAQKK